ncbi:MAG: hypothetical protein H0T78_11085, partial [Longispora sp.]|nr:hypothetical protein [Longispora sp. (in: high G+C Gram-positive bacteria)]
MEKPEEKGIEDVEVTSSNDVEEFNEMLPQAIPILLAMMNEDQREQFAGIPPNDWDFSSLPPEIWGVIGEQLGVEGKVKLGRVNRALAKLIGKVDSPNPGNFAVDSQSTSPAIQEGVQRFRYHLSQDPYDDSGIAMFDIYPVLTGSGTALEKLRILQELYRKLQEAPFVNEADFGNAADMNDAE